MAGEAGSERDDGRFGALADAFCNFAHGRCREARQAERELFAPVSSGDVLVANARPQDVRTATADHRAPPS